MDFADLKFMSRAALDLARASPRSNADSAEWYYFLHIPKTAGTSFRYALYEQFRANEVYPNVLDYYLRHGGRYLSFEELCARKEQLFPLSISLLIGHYQLSPIDRKFREPLPRTICFLRHPLARVISSIKYQSQAGRIYHGLSLDQVISKYGLVEGQLQASSLGYRANEGNMAEACDNLEQVNALGLVEYYPESIDLINSKFGWGLSSGHKKNEATENPCKGLTGVQLERLSECCKIDIELYDHALKLFQARCGQS